MSADPVTIEVLASGLGRKQNDPLLARVTMEIGAPLRRVVEHLTYLDYRAEGISMIFDKESYLEAVFLFSEGYEGYVGFRGQLPGGVRFGQDSAAVCEKLGEPVMSGGGKLGILGKIVPPWQKYDFGQYLATIQYNPESLAV